MPPWRPLPPLPLAELPPLGVGLLAGAFSGAFLIPVCLVPGHEPDPRPAGRRQVPTSPDVSAEPRQLQR
jgi:hypothetical protein